MRRFNALVDTHGFFNDLQMCPCGFETLGGFDAETLAAELIERADSGNYSEEDCNYRPMKWIEKAIMMSERLIGTREGEVPKEAIYKTVQELCPEYGKESVSFKEAEGLLRGKITKMVESSIKAKQHFFVFPENPNRWIEIRPFFEGHEIDEKSLSRALWAYSDGFNKIDAAHEEGRAELDAFFTVYPDFCYDGARATIKDGLLQYNDTLRKMEMAALSERIIKKLAETGEPIKPQLSCAAKGIAESMYFKAETLEKDILKALKNAYVNPELKKMENAGNREKKEYAKPNSRLKEKYLECCRADDVLEAFEQELFESEEGRAPEDREKYFGMLKKIVHDKIYSRADCIIEKYQKAEEKTDAPKKPLILPYSGKNADVLRPVDMEDAPKVVLIDWRKSREDAMEAQEYIIVKLEENFKRAETAARQLSSSYLVGAKSDTAYLIGF